MTRRLTLAILGTVVATLVLTGLVTIVLASFRGRAETEATLRHQAAEIQAGLTDEFTVSDIGDDGIADTDAQVRRELLRRARLVGSVGKVLNIDELAVLFQLRNGDITGDLPAGVTVDALQLERIRAGEVVSGSIGSTVFAAAGVAVAGRATAFVVLTRQVDAGLGSAMRWFVVASLVTILIGAVVAWMLGRRLTRPVREASAAAHRIADGELSTRLAAPPPAATDELAELARSVNSMAAALERSKALEQRFLLSVSHDLRTPLTSIRGYAEAITDGAGDPRRSAEVILGESRRLERLVADLLDLAKFEANGFSLAITPVDLSAVARSTVAGFAPAAAARGLRLELAGSERLAVMADPDRIAQVLANLTENALKYASARVTITVSEPDPGAGPRPRTDVLLVIDDDGPGIAAQDLPHIFERLYQARHQPERKEASSGLGLAIARELVEAMHGELTAGTAPDGGARFSLRLPRAEA